MPLFHKLEGKHLFMNNNVFLYYLYQQCIKYIKGLPIPDGESPYLIVVDNRLSLCCDKNGFNTKYCKKKK